MKRCRRPSRGLALCVVLFAGAPASLADPAADDWIEIPVVVNIYKGSNVTEDEAKKYVERANEVLKQAKIKLKTTKTNTDFEVGNNDADQAESEDAEAEKKGKEELEAANKGKGIKINFCNNPIASDTNVNGWAKHKSPVIFVRESDTVEKSGNTVAHECCHVLTIAYDLYGDDTTDRLMHGTSETRTGTDLTDEEIEEIRKGAAKRGEVVTKEAGQTPSEPKQKEVGFGYNFDPGSPIGHLGVRDASITSLEGDAHYACYLASGGFWPPFAPSNYLFLFDIDQNTGTGQFFAGFPGVERAVVLSPQSPPSPLVQVQALDLMNPVNNFSTQGQRTSESQFIDVDVGLAVPLPWTDVYDFELPIAWVSSGPDPIATVHVASGSMSGIVDAFAMELDRADGDRGPFVLTDDGEIDAGGGEPFVMSGMLFPPLAALEVTLDDEPLGVVSADPIGQFTVAMTLDPATLTDAYFLTVSDPVTGVFGFAVIEVLGVGPCPADLSGSVDPNDPAYGVPDGTVDSADFFYFLDQFVAENLAVADLTGSADPNDPAYGMPDGVIDASDFFFYLDLFVQGCP